MAKLLTKKEYKSRRVRYKAFAGIIDALVVIACAVLVIVCVQLVISLFNWLSDDIDESFGVFTKIMKQVLRTNK